jgi:hypothetical protein
MNLDDQIPGLSNDRTTHVYTTWHRDELEVRSFLLASARGMSTWFSTKEDEAEAAVANLDPEYMHGSEAYDHFMEEVGIFWESYWNQLASAVIKDAFTLFEVFLEESVNNLLSRYNSRLVTLDTEDSWRMSDCRWFCEAYLGFDLMTDELDAIQWIRNKLSHLRNELRTEGGREEFATKLSMLGVSHDQTSDEENLQLSHFEYGRDLTFAKSLVMSPLEAWRMLDLLRLHVDALAHVFYRFRYDPVTTEALSALGDGIPARKRDEKFLFVPDSPVKNPSM